MGKNNLRQMYHSDVTRIPHDIRDQFLFITAGIVLLTSLINATTIKALVKGLGLTKVPLAKATLVNHTIDKLRYSAELRLELMKKDRFMGGADWSHVEKFLPEPWNPSKDEIFDKVENGLIKELRINLLNKEKSSYWKLFSKGLLGRRVALNLDGIIMIVLDINCKICASMRRKLFFS